MKRYESRPRSALVQGEDAYLYDSGPSNPPSVTVLEAERIERRTGLFGQHGDPIVMIEETAPIGFGRCR